MSRSGPRGLGLPVRLVFLAVAGACALPAARNLRAPAEGSSPPDAGARAAPPRADEAPCGGDRYVDTGFPTLVTITPEPDGSDGGRLRGMTPDAPFVHGVAAGD